MSVKETGSVERSADPTIDLAIRPARHPWRWVAVAFVALLAAMTVHTLFANPRFEWSVVGQYFTSDTILLGVRRTLELTAIAMVMGVVLGVMLAVMRLSPNPVLSGSSWLFVWFFRGSPLLVQLLLWYNLSALFPNISLGIPFVGPDFVQLDANALITPYIAAILGLGLNEAAYSAEIIRAGIISIDHGQTEAAQSIGMSRWRLLRRVVLPQAMRVIIPPLGNDTINMLKMSALVSTIAVPELLFAAQTIYTRTFETIPLLMVAVIWYLIIVSVLSVIQYYIERHYARGSSRNLPPTPLQSIGSFLGLSRARTLDAGEKRSLS
ncbi:amino acid ABC transporter permease [Mesorhizobium sp.]|uniref:amino acid ABC transporter permease n=1 Tax=Mesorhizobium sp. TaxID=1871066 RepID=UPI0025EEE77F|nr:amino acid ABC transporter permease [Mesorhizobium sp.]